MPMNINPHIIHHPHVNPQESVSPYVPSFFSNLADRIEPRRIPFPTVVLPGGGRLAIYPTVKTRYPGPTVGLGAGVRFDFPLPSSPSSFLFLCFLLSLFLYRTEGM